MASSQLTMTAANNTDGTKQGLSWAPAAGTAVPVQGFPVTAPPAPSYSSAQALLGQPSDPAVTLVAPASMCHCRRCNKMVMAQPRMRTSRGPTAWVAAAELSSGSRAWWLLSFFPLSILLHNTKCTTFECSSCHWKLYKVKRYSRCGLVGPQGKTI